MIYTGFRCVYISAASETVGVRKFFARQTDRRKHVSFRRLIALVAGLTLLLTLSAGALRPASADVADSAKATVYPETVVNFHNQDPDFCFNGADPQNQTNGFINVYRDGNTLTVDFHLRGAAPNASYQINLSCQVGDIATLVTNKDGVGNVTFSRNVSPGETQFVFDACLMPCGTRANETYYASGLVTLP